MKVSRGDLVEVPLPQGIAYGVVALCPAAYPPAIAFLPWLYAAPLDDPEQRLGGAEPVVALVPLPAATRIVSRGHEVGEVKFQVPVRDWKGRVLYAWEWDGARIRVGSETSRKLPERRVMGPDQLAKLLRGTAT